MPNLDNLGIELVDRDLGMLSVPRGLRSIRFKNLSFGNISKLWSKFKSEQLANKEKVENNIGVSYDESLVQNASLNETSEKIGKTPAITRLEEKINILDNAGLSSLVGNRAIKLKDNMNKNTRYNSKSAYSNLSTEENGFFPKDADYLLDENGLYVPNKKDKVDTDYVSENVRDDVIVVPDRGDVKKVVEDAFSKQEGDVRTVSPEEVADVVEKDSDEIVNKEDVKKIIDDSLESEINREKIKQAVEDAINQRVSTSASRAAKIEYFSEPANENIHEDGSYRLTKEQIDEEFRKTYINEPKQDVKESADDVEFAIEEELNSKNDKEGELMEIDANNEVINKDEPVHFDYDIDNVSNLTVATDSDRSNPRSEIEILMERVRVLKQKQQESKERADKAALQAKASEDAREDAISRLRAYADALEEDSGYNDRSAEENMKKAESNEKLIEDMLSMIQPQVSSDSVKAK